VLRRGAELQRGRDVSRETLVPDVRALVLLFLYFLLLQGVSRLFRGVTEFRLSD
jgi:hypothetical protein